MGCLRELQERFWSSLLWQQQIFLQGSSSEVVTHGQNILICLNSSKDLPLPWDQFEGLNITMKIIFYSSDLCFHL